MWVAGLVCRPDQDWPMLCAVLVALSPACEAHAACASIPLGIACHVARRLNPVLHAPQGVSLGQGLYAAPGWTNPECWFWYSLIWTGPEPACRTGPVWVLQEAHTPNWPLCYVQWAQCWGQWIGLFKGPTGCIIQLHGPAPSWSTTWNMFPSFIPQMYHQDNIMITSVCNTRAESSNDSQVS